MRGCAHAAFIDKSKISSLVSILAEGEGFEFSVGSDMHSEITRDVAGQLRRCHDPQMHIPNLNSKAEARTSALSDPAVRRLPTFDWTVGANRALLWVRRRSFEAG